METEIGGGTEKIKLRRSKKKKKRRRRRRRRSCHWDIIRVVTTPLAAADACIN